MKKNILLLAFLITITNSLFADAITEMEEWQAKKVVSYLQAESYVMPYCDCCENKPLNIVEIENINIEPTEGNLYQVRVRGKIIASISTDEVGRLINPKPSTRNFNELISLNYTFIPQRNKLVSLAKGVGIMEVRGYNVITCQQFVDIPQPTNAVLQGNTKYLDWYNSHMEDLDFTHMLSGSWKILSLQDKYGDTMSENLPSWRVVFKSDSTYFTNIADGETGVWNVVNNELKMTSDETRLAQTIPFFLDDEVLQIKLYRAEDGLVIVNFTKQ